MRPLTHRRRTGNFQDELRLYMVFEYVPGGELFGLLKNGALKEKHARFYAAETILCFQYFHNHCKPATSATRQRALLLATMP